MVASDRRANALCAGSMPGAMIKDQYTKPVRKTSTAMSSAAVIVVSTKTPRCGQATSAISGSADAHNCRMIGHLNHGRSVAWTSSPDAQAT